MHRKLFNDFISASTAKDHDVNQAKVVSDLLVNLHRKPEAFREHINLSVIHPPRIAMVTHLTSFNATSRLTGSLALSIAYGIRADTSHNEFILMYEKILKAAQEGLVPGTFFVDIFPFRMPDLASMGCRGISTDDDLSQSGIYLRGSPVCNSTRTQTGSKRTCTRLWPDP
jgi:hypothetical protein